uniref:NR LBD domain-containing protein n=1 Tax=Heligmosomoides polygyrus TaxID=6339 RepID=A0A183FM14_HELPZ
LVRNFAFAFNLLNRVFYSPDHGPDKIVFQNGAFIMRQPQQQLRHCAIIGLSANIYATDGRDHAAVPTTAIVRLGIRHLQSGVVFQSRYEFLSSVPCRVAVIDLVFWRHLDVMRSFHIADALDLSSQAKPDVYEERNKYLSALFTCITNKLGMAAGVQKYGSLLMMTASIQNILAQNEENMQVMELFKNWEVDPFVKELCMKRA